MTDNTKKYLEREVDLASRCVTAIEQAITASHAGKIKMVAKILSDWRIDASAITEALIQENSDYCAQVHTPSHSAETIEACAKVADKLAELFKPDATGSAHPSDRQAAQSAVNALENAAANIRALPAQPEPAQELPASDLVGRDLPVEFEQWWAAHPYCNDDKAPYRIKKQIAWDAYYKAATSKAKQPPADDYQDRVAKWMVDCFTPEIAADKLERNDRFIEEALELVQSLDYSADRAHELVEYVFNRPKGEPSQEVGGVMVTLAALCSPNGLEMMKSGETEYARINQPAVIEKIRTKQATKPTGSALPIPKQPPNAGLVEALELCHLEMATTMAFIGRDIGTERLGKNMESCAQGLAEADSKALAALSTYKGEG